MIPFGFEFDPEWTARYFPTFQRAHRKLRFWSINWFDKTFKLLRRIEAGRMKLPHAMETGDSDVYWLLPFRDELRSLIGYGHIGSIKIYLRSCPRKMEPLGVWLLGQCADHFRHYGLQRYAHHPSPTMRRIVAKALRRLEAWTLLNELAAAYPDDEAVQRFAAATKIRRSFSERLMSYKRDLDDSHAGEVATPSQMPYWAMEKSWEYTPPKSVDMIRRMLRRIRHWVRWGVG